MFSLFCRLLVSGGTRIRTGDTMIFSHIREALRYAETRIGRRIYVHRVPLDTSSVLSLLLTRLPHSERHRMQNAYVCSPDSSIGLLSLSAILRRRIGAQPQRDVGRLHRLRERPAREDHRQAPNEPCALLRNRDVPLLKCWATGKAGGGQESGLGKEENGYTG